MATLVLCDCCNRPVGNDPHEVTITVRRAGRAPLEGPHRHLLCAVCTTLVDQLDLVAWAAAHNHRPRTVELP